MALDQETIDAQLELLAVHRRTLAVYLRQQAQLGVLTPPGVINGIAETQSAIHQIKEQLRADRVSVEDQPNDDLQPSAVTAMEAERKVADQRAQDAALQAYLDQMTQLLLHEKLRTSQPDDEVRSLARVRTLTVLEVLDGMRKATVLQFLYEAGLIGGIKQEEDDVPRTIDVVVSLFGANLMGVSLMGVNLAGANLMGTNLCRANLAGANLMGANLIMAVLLKANLHLASLRSAKLIQAALQEANLEGAILWGADLTNCIVTREQLAQARSLKGAILPFDMTPPPVPEVKVAAQNDSAKEPTVAAAPVRKEK